MQLTVRVETEKQFFRLMVKQCQILRQLTQKLTNS